jgi:hypothetical protein
MTRSASVSIALFVALTTSCGVTPPSSPPRARAAYDYGCGEDKLTVTNISGGTFRVTGCGHDAIYDCIYGSAAVTCMPENSGAASVVHEAKPSP